MSKQTAPSAMHDINSLPASAETLFGQIGRGAASLPIAKPSSCSADILVSLSGFFLAPGFGEGLWLWIRLCFFEYFARAVPQKLHRLIILSPWYDG